MATLSSSASRFAMRVVRRHWSSPVGRRSTGPWRTPGPPTSTGSAALSSSSVCDPGTTRRARAGPRPSTSSTRPTWPPGGQGRSGLVVIRLRDGTVTTIGPGIAAPDVPAMPPPLRLPEAGGRDAAEVALNDGVSLVDGSGHAPRMIAPGPGVPIVAGPDTSGPDGSARLAWLANDGLHSAHLRIGRDGSTHVSDISSLGPDQIGAGRWPLIVAGTANDLNAHGVASAWLGDLAETGCPDLVVPGAIEPCGPVQLR